MENRRSFLSRAALGAAVAGVSKAPAATDQLTVGFIGTGTRAQHALIPQFKFNPAFRIAAVCDVYQPNMEAAAKVAASNPDMYGDYRRIIDRKDIDVVVIATPDHWHCPIAIAACEAGKDIYLEKPVSNDIDMCMKAVAAAREHKRVVQVGLMQRSSAPFMEAYKVIESGIIGNVRHAMVVNPGGGGGFGGSRGGAAAGRGAAGTGAGRGDAAAGAGRSEAGAGAGRGGPGAGGGRMAMSAESSAPPPGLDWEMFQGPAPRRPYSSSRQRSWRSYWEYGGGPLSDWGVHLLDIVHWYLGVTAPSTRAAASYGWFSRPQDDRVPDTTEVAWQYPKFVADYSSRSDAQGTYIWGDRGMLFVNRQGYEVKPSGGGRGGGAFEAKKVALHDEPPQGGAGFDTDAGRHILNFLACIKSREKPVCDIEIGAFSTIPLLMAGVSIRSGGKTIAWNGHGAEPMA
ncbi:MAG: Gfo/Idh/MocA family oxidoreductase [Bryobacteraceae bacterium]|jgi:predicted dehydrogenase